MGLHSTLPGLPGFARRSRIGVFNRIEVPPPLQLSSLSPGAHALPVAWRWRIAEVTKNGLKSSTERGPLSFSSVRPPWVNRVILTVGRSLPVFPPEDGVIGRPSLWIAEDFWVLRFRLTVKRGPWLRPQASEGEAQHGPFWRIGRIGQGDEHLHCG